LKTRTALLSPSWTQRLAAISVVGLAHIVVVLLRGFAPAGQTQPVVETAAKPIPVSVFLAPSIERPRLPARSERLAPATKSLAVPPTTPLPTAVNSAPVEPFAAASAETSPRASAGAPETFDSDADYSRNPPPRYPPASRHFGEEGRVLVSVLVLADGTVKEAFVETSSGHPRLDLAALESVRQWTFVPATRGGIAIAVRIRVPLDFVLSP
jgi:protein TonB